MTYRKLMISAVVTFGILGTAAMASAAELKTHYPDTVVELFTSQGCSSCPPANRFVTEISNEPDLLALSYGVHYWDYLGWKDTFASPEFTKRQRDYGKAFGAPNVYTPQIVLNGSSHSPRYSRNDVKSMVLKPERPLLKLDKTDGTLTYKLEAPSDYRVILISYRPGDQAVPVRRGENSGRTLTITNVVTDITPFPSTGILDVSFAPGTHFAALVHDPESAKIVSAAVYTP